MQVIHFLMDHRLGGPHVFAKTLSENLKKNGDFQFTYVTPARGELTDIALVNLRHFFSPLYVLEVPINTLLAARLAYPRPVLFHVHGAANIAPVIAAGLTNTPLLWTFHETVPGFLPLVKFAKKFLKPGAYRVTGVTAASAQVYQTPEALTLPAPVDPEAYQPQSLEARPIDPTKGPRFFSLANLNPLKGQDVLLEALAGLSGPWSLRLAGQELKTHQAYAAQLHQKARVIKAQNPLAQIEFLGWCSPAQVKAELNQTDLFILPSRSEGTPIALLEAMAMGTVSIASLVGGIGQIVAQKTQGFLVPPEEPKALLGAIETFLGLSLEERSAIKKAARVHVIEQYAVQKIAAQFGALYQELTA